MSTSLTTAQQAYWAQVPRLRGKTNDLLELLKDGQWHSNWEAFEAGGLSFQGRLCSLRKAGYKIDSRYVSPGHWDYRLNGWAQPLPKNLTLSKPQRRTLAKVEAAILDEYGVDGLARVAQRLPSHYRNPDEAGE